MDNILKKVFYVISIILIVIASAYQIAILYQGDKSVTEGVLDGYFYIAYIAFGISLVLAILFPIIQMISNPKAAVRSLIGIGIVIVLWFVASAFAGNEFTPEEMETMKTTAETSTLVGTALIFTYFTFALAILSILYASVVSMFK